MIQNNSKTRLFILLSAGFILPFLGVVFLNFAPDIPHLISEALHSSVHAGGVGGAFVIVVFLLLLLKQEKIDALHVWTACAFFNMAVLELYHSVVHVGHLFVWLHSTSHLVGGALFVFIWLPERISKSNVVRRLLIVFSLLVIGFGGWSVSFPDWIPEMISGGKFTSTAIAINVIGGVLFLLASIRFIVRYFENKEFWNSFLFAVLCLLFGFAGILFAISELWDGDWWWWHILRFMAYAFSVAFLFVRFQQTNKQLRQEVLDREKAKDELMQEKSFVEMLINVSPIIILVLDVEGRIVRYNAYFEDLTGYPLEEMKGKDWFSNFLPIEDHDEIRELFKKAVGDIRTKGNINPILTKEGKEVPVEWYDNSLKDLSGNTLGLLAIGLDITERQQAEEKSKRHTEFLNAVINSLSHPFYVVNLEDHSIELANQAAKEKGLSHGRDGCSRADNSQDPCNDPECPLEVVRKTKQPLIADQTKLDDSKEPEHLEIRAYPMFDADGQVDKVIEYSLNVTDQKKMTQQLEIAKEQAETANIAKSEFLANMSHELRTPLNAILGFSQVLEKNELNNLSSKQQQHIAYIKEGGSHLLNMVNDILDLSKIEAGKLEIDFKPFDFESMLNRSTFAVKAEAQKKEIRIETSIEKNLGWLKGDETRIKQVIYNLLSNALKFTPPGKRIGLNASSQGEQVSIEVWDEGVGIDNSNFERIFEPFEQIRTHQQSKEKGTGLGLAITKKIIDMHLGSITVTSTIGEGSQFKVQLNGRVSVNEQSSIEKDGKDRLDAIPDKSSKRILVVEDNERNIDLMVSVLEIEGYQLRCAETGEEAIQLFADDKFDLVLMDIQLPGISGIQAMQMIKDKTKTSIPFIALTAFAMKGDREKLLAEGFDDYLSKPININTLNNSLLKHLSKI